MRVRNYRFSHLLQDFAYVPLVSVVFHTSYGISLAESKMSPGCCITELCRPGYDYQKQVEHPETFLLNRPHVFVRGL